MNYANGKNAITEEGGITDATPHQNTILPQIASEHQRVPIRTPWRGVFSERLKSILTSNNEDTNENEHDISTILFKEQKEVMEGEEYRTKQKQN